MHRKKETEEEGSDGNLAKKKTISTFKVMSTHMWVVFFSLKKTLYFWPPVKKKCQTPTDTVFLITLAYTQPHMQLVRQSVILIP